MINIKEIFHRFIFAKQSNDFPQSSSFLSSELYHFVEFHFYLILFERCKVEKHIKEV